VRVLSLFRSGPVARRNAALWLLASGACLRAAPVLRVSEAAIFVKVAAGADAPVQTVMAYNPADGSLSLSLAVEQGIAWLTAATGTPQACPYSALCIPVQFTFHTATLPPGVYTAPVTVSDPSAIDAPQVITVTVQIGDQPAAVDAYVAPGSKTDIPVDLNGSHDCTGPCPDRPYAVASTQDGGQWLSLAFSGHQMSTLFVIDSFFIELAPPPSMPAGTYQGTFSIINTSDNRTIPVTMRVTTQPIAVPSTDRVSLRLAQNGPVAAYPFLPAISLTNNGLGTLAVQDVSGSGAGVSAYHYQGLAIVTVDPAGLAPGIHDDGMITIQCNAVNCPLRIPVRVEIVPQAPPVIAYRGVVDNATFDANNPVAQGGVAIVKGEQLSLQPPQFASGGAPLPLTLGGATVRVNGRPAPLYYSSYGQIALQMPSGIAPGQVVVDIVRDGAVSNAVLVTVAGSAPQVVAVSDLAYHRIDPDHPAKPAQTIILWSIGLGPTHPPVLDGMPAPYPPATLDPSPSVRFGPVPQRLGTAIFDLTPSFAGLSPGSIGLYQVIVTLPAGIPPGMFLIALGHSAPVSLPVE